jgi:hypothetical protein
MARHQEVSKSLLKLGYHADGVGRLNMQGKTCEVKAAMPKDPGQNPLRGNPCVRGNHGDHSIIHNDPVYVLPPYHHQPYAPFPYHNHHHRPYPPFVADPMIAAFPPQQAPPAVMEYPTISGPYHQGYPAEYPTIPGPYQGYPTPGAMAGHMAPMHYPTAIPTMPPPMNAPMVPPADYYMEQFHMGHAYPYPPPMEAGPMPHHPYAFMHHCPQQPPQPN